MRKYNHVLLCKKNTLQRILLLDWYMGTVQRVLLYIGNCILDIRGCTEVFGTFLVKLHEISASVNRREGM